MSVSRYLSLWQFFVALLIRTNSSNWNSSCEMQFYVIMLSLLFQKALKKSCTCTHAVHYTAPQGASLIRTYKNFKIFMMQSRSHNFIQNCISQDEFQLELFMPNCSAKKTNTDMYHNLRIY